MKGDLVFMDQNTFSTAEELCKGLLFHRRYNDVDVLVLWSWLQDHRSVKVYRHRNGFLTLSYCGRCSTIVAEGDRYCSQCGRELRWE